jgi:hypothetical protein
VFRKSADYNQNVQSRFYVQLRVSKSRKSRQDSPCPGQLSVLKVPKYEDRALTPWSYHVVVKNA